MEKKITTLVAGGAGFIGSHLCAALLEKGHRVVCVDNLLTGSKRNIEPLLSNDRFEFIEQDIISYELQGTNCEFDFIYHLASPASPVQYGNYPIETLHVNSIGTENMLKLAQEHNAKMLYTSTSEVYGDPHEHPQKETYWGNVNSYGPRSCYDEGKRYGEALCYTYFHKHDVDIRLVRIFNTYGPNMEQDDGRVISNFAGQAVSGKPITVHGDGKQTRSFCYVSDLVRGLILAMETDNTTGEIINLGNPDERSMNEIAEQIKTLSQSTSEITHVAGREEDISRRKPDISKAKKLLDWKPQVSLEDGLQQTIHYFKELT
jgi:dTDP-glucose 4,6-dehydratase/UDP-glucuronate decarboxylase